MNNTTNCNKIALKLKNSLFCKVSKTSEKIGNHQGYFILNLHSLKRFKYGFNPLTTNVHHRVDPSQLTYIANQLTSFYLMRNIDR